MSIGFNDTTLNGLLKKLEMLKLSTSNIANAQTLGYQRKIPESLTFQSVLGNVIVDKSQGQLKRTGITFDLAVEGNAYFMVDTKKGLDYTRDGRFHLNNKGEIVTQEGNRVVVIEKTNKPIDLAKESDIKINEHGEIFIGLEKYGRIALKAMDSNTVRVHQGYVEGSNVNLVNEMVSLQILNRSVEASEKFFGMESSIDKDLIEKYGRNV